MIGFLIRVGFWLGLVLVLIPRNGEDTAGTAVSVGPLQVLNTTTAIIGDFAGICGRKPEVCESAGEIMHAIGLRAREGAAVALSAISGATGKADDSAIETGSVERTEGED